MDPTHFKFIVDPLYGRVSIDAFLADLISQPEMQRLRDVRLSNINSLLLPGGSNISRFEHCVGTALLAERVAQVLHLDTAARLRLVCAALLHDVAITPFGHLMEEGFQVAGRPYNHETRLQQIFTENAELGNVDRQIFLGRSAGFRAVLEKNPYRRERITPHEVFDVMQGRGTLGRLIKGSIDLDNIDNVCRMAYHIGIPFRKEVPLDIVGQFMWNDECIGFNSSRIELIEEWLDLRGRLYDTLMTNPIDFSAKAMLIEAIRLAIVGTSTKGPIIDDASWSLTDSQLWNALADYSPSRELVNRLALGDHFDIAALYWISGAANSERLRARANSTQFRREFSQILGLPLSDVLVYWIRDKRGRQIDNLTFFSRTEPSISVDLKIGRDSDKVLFGVVVSRRGFVTRKHDAKCETFLADVFGSHVLSKCDPRTHLRRAFEWRDAHSDAQLALFE